MPGMNAWNEPWLVVRTNDRATPTVSLRELYLRAHEFTGLGPGLTPLDTDSLLRLLPAIGAVVLRSMEEADDAATNEGRYPLEAIEAFESTFDLSLFDLFGEKPFLQRWDKSPADVDVLVDGKKTFLTREAVAKSGKALLRPMEQLHPSEPGASSAQWAIRRDLRDASDRAELITLLVTTWFQTKNGNSKDIFGSGAPKGSVGTWHVNPLAVYLIDPLSLGRTLMANTPLEWLQGDTLPAFFDRAPAEQALRDLAAQPLDLYRCTYAKTLPLVYPVDGVPAGFVLGADSGIPVPPLSGDVKEALGMIHDGDHTRMYVVDDKKGTRKARGSFGLRLASAEGFNQWFRDDRKTDESLKQVLSLPRLLEPETLTGWEIGLFSETSDGKGTRTWCDWSTLPANPAGADVMARTAFSTLMGLASKARGAIYYGLKVASGDSQTPASVDMAQGAFFANIEQVLTEALYDLDQGREVPMRPYADRVLQIAIDTFEAVTEVYATPQSIAVVSLARSGFARSVRASLDSTYSKE